MNYHLPQEIKYSSIEYGMDDAKFSNLALLPWYKDDIDSIIDCVKIGNAFIAEKEQRKTNYGAQFKKEDFINR